MQIIRVCLHNAPIPYDQGEGAKELKKLQEKVVRQYQELVRHTQSKVRFNTLRNINEQHRTRSCFLDSIISLSFSKIRSFKKK